MLNRMPPSQPNNPSNETLQEPMGAPILLATETRGDFSENYHWGWVATAGFDKVDLDGKASEEPTLPQVFFRSAAKPFQFLGGMQAVATQRGVPLSTVLERWPLEAIAVACASHSGMPQHQQWVRWILNEAGLEVEALQCGAHPPIDTATWQGMLKAEETPSPIHHNCSGKHAAMLWVCQQLGWPLAGYLAFEHPLQQTIHQGITQWCGLEAPPPRAVDGCGAPVFYVPLHSMAQAYLNLVQATQAQRVVEAMTTHPALVSATLNSEPYRIDMAVMTAGEGQVLSKVGADGVMVVAHRGHQQAIALKLASGQNEMRDIIMLQWLQELGWIASTHPALSHYQNALHRLNQASQEAGQVQVYALKQIQKTPEA